MCEHRLLDEGGEKAVCVCVCVYTSYLVPCMPRWLGLGQRGWKGRWCVRAQMEAEERYVSREWGARGVCLVVDDARNGVDGWMDGSVDG